MNIKKYFISLLFSFFTLMIQASEFPAEMLGDWSLKLESQEAGWISIELKDQQPSVSMMVNVGSVKPIKGITIKNKILHVPLRTQRDGGKKGPILFKQRATIEWKEGQLQGHVITHYPATKKEEHDAFIGVRIPPMPAQPNLMHIKWGNQKSLFNGKNLDGWRLRRPEKINGWSVEKGLLVNSTPKTDFSATGAYGNLRTNSVFKDFKLNIEFLVEKNCNSGIYIRGLYEAQVVDRDSRMQGLQGIGSIFARIERSENAAYEGGTWQDYEITLYKRHLTVLLNGVKVIDNHPVKGPTPGAMHTNPMTAGPIYLQGDHTSVKYRHIILTPILE